MRFLLFLFLIPIFCPAQVMVEPFDGAITDWEDEWWSGDGHAIRTYDSTLAGHEGEAALKVEWKLDVVDYGGGVSFAYYCGPGEIIDMMDHDTLTIWYYIEQPGVSPHADSIAFSIVFRDNTDDFAYNADTTKAELWRYDDYAVYYNTVGWHAIHVPLRQDDDPTKGLVHQGDVYDGFFDPDYVRGWYLEWGTWGTSLVDTDGTIADSGIVYFDNMVLGKVPAPTAVKNRTQQSIMGFALKQNYPNPFNPVTTIDYYLPARQKVRLEIYNIAGKRVEALVNETQTAGWHQARFDGASLVSGVYLYKITAGEHVALKKMTLVK